MVGLGMIFDDTYRPLFEQLHAEDLYRRDFGLVEVELAAGAGEVVVAVADSGPGLSEEALAHAFEPFFSTKGQQGTGLGLALSREFVERWGGRIEAANRPGGGARVTVTLRRAGPEDPPGPGGGAREAPGVASAG